MIDDHTELIKFYCKLIHSFIIFEIFSINDTEISELDGQ